MYCYPSSPPPDKEKEKYKRALLHIIRLYEKPLPCEQVAGRADKMYLAAWRVLNGEVKS